jgi:hypothetical protein
LKKLVVTFVLVMVSLGYADSLIRAYGFLSHSAPGKTIKAENWPYQKMNGLNLFGAGLVFHSSVLHANAAFFQTNYATAYDLQIGVKRDFIGLYYGKHGALTTNDQHDFLSPQYIGLFADAHWDKAAFRLDGQYGFGQYTHVYPSPELFYFDAEEKKDYSAFILAPQVSYNVISKLHVVFSMGLEKYSFMEKSNMCWTIGLVFGDSFFRFFNAARSMNYDTPDPHLIRKPNIYLYPEIPKQVDVSLQPHGHITVSIPEYNSGWSVWAEPTGRLDDMYDFLFYEAEVPLVKPKVGWCVSADNLEFFFSTTLHAFGFNEKEIYDFLDYWLPILNEAPFYEIRPLVNAELDWVCPITITPQPDNLLRLWLLFTPRQQQTNMPGPRIPLFEKSGFYATEWGGAVVP